MLVLIWIQTVWHSDGVPEEFFGRVDCSSVCMQNFRKILTTASVIAKFKYLTFDPLGGVKGVG